MVITHGLEQAAGAAATASASRCWWCQQRPRSGSCRCRGGSRMPPVRCGQVMEEISGDRFNDEAEETVVQSLGPRPRCRDHAAPPILKSAPVAPSLSSSSTFHIHVDFDVPERRRRRLRKGHWKGPAVSSVRSSFWEAARHCWFKEFRRVRSTPSGFGAQPLKGRRRARRIYHAGAREGSVGHRVRRRRGATTSSSCVCLLSGV